MNSMRMVIAGGSGFIGRALTREFLTRGYEIAVLTRSPRPRENGVREIAWDGQGIGDWASVLDGAAAVINLAGKTINCPHTPENLRDITASRVHSVNAIAAAIGKAAAPPRVWVQASAVGFYGNAGDVVCDEAAPAGDDTLANICRQWEGAFSAAAVPATRRVTLRIGFVLGRDGGGLPVLAKMTRCFLGGAAGSGKQYLSWIHVMDLARMFVSAVENENLAGVCNAVGPCPTTNADFMRALRHALHRPWSPPAPALAVKLGARLMGSEGSLALVSQRCLPKRFAEAGFQFQFKELDAALKNLCGKMTNDQ